ncbi:ubiquitin-like protein smt3 [Pseudoloma neurophilia]|uniref:Ubiquitin-like protein smt3 n=1 Tax=Pseudoloma neurophilia TaxID=146866 RepID=A0A0R0M4F4_9MICR|nr:ubiquitin-like protein smt3 [Pseudoloma neurophilia]
MTHFPSKEKNQKIKGPRKMSQDHESKSKLEEDRVKIIIIDNQGNQIEYKVKKTVPLGKLTEIYAKKYSKETNQLRMTWMGRNVTKSETPESLGLPDGALIEIVTPQEGGSS